ncbi:DUF4274 domain-containing protein [Nocardiopsis sp. CC223A]|uniref:DUF4274 domain-containing protein n=1 Tax=Nocardiopsis sp. CC223A TaxID=3044051 RepID=UPI00278BB8E1|nr:DUF4274 domain-containing protein [Nocardiopsis sp. CC223A]
MDSTVESVLSHEADGHGSLADRVAELTDERRLWELMSAYNWDEGFEVPLAVVTHPRCDRALALRLFWELDDTARIHHSDEANALRENHTAEARYQPEDFDRMVRYCSTLVSGLWEGTFPIGANSFDTGFFGLDDPALTDRQRALRTDRTRRAQQEYEDGFLRPVTPRSADGTDPGERGV